MLKTQAIVLSALKYGETSLILQMYTRAEGRASFIINGVRKAKSKISAGILQPGSITEVTAYFKPGDGLNRIKEVKPAVLYQQIPFKIYKRAVSVFSVELLSKTILERDANNDLFDFLVGYFTTLDKTSSSVSNYPIYLMRQLSYYHGFGPQANYSDINHLFDLMDGLFTDQLPQHRHIVKDALARQFHHSLSMRLDEDTMHLSRQERSALLATWIDYFRIHIEGFKELHSQKIWAEVLG